MLRKHIIGLDISLNGTGAATSFGVTKLKPPSGHNRGAARLVWVRDQVEERVRATNARLAVIENYSFGSRNGREAQGEMGGVIRAMLYENGVAYVEIAIPTLKKFATGVGKGEKVNMIIQARERLGYTGSDDDECDALWLREAGLVAYGLSKTKLPKAQVEHIKKVVDWPTLR